MYPLIMAFGRAAGSEQCDNCHCCRVPPAALLVARGREVVQAATPAATAPISDISPLLPAHWAI